MIAWWNWHGTARPAGRVGKVNRRQAHFSPLALSAGFALLACLSPASQATPQSVAGISHYEVVVIGASMDSNEWNIAYEVTDCGLVVGQIRRNGVQEAFVFASRAQFGLLANELVILPNPVGVGAVAFDVNEQGVIVGAVGGLDPLDLAEERAAVWRLASQGPAISFEEIPPPPDTFFRDYASGGFGRLASVSTDGNDIWAAGHFRRDANCGIGQLGTSRLGAVAVRLTGSTPVLADYRWDPAETEGPSQAHGIARGAEYLAGVSSPCFPGAPCGLPDGIAARSWAPSPMPNALTAFARHTDPNPATVDAGRSEIRAILGDGSAVGGVADHWSGDGGLCRTVAAVWDAGTGAVFGILPPNSIEAHGKGSMAYDLEASAFAHQGIVSGRFAAGTIRVTGGSDGVLWSRVESATAWSHHFPVNMVSCPDINSDGQPPRCLRITQLHGVNRRGDLVGQIEIGDALRPVLLRAVPIACVGDISQDGLVNASDLAILLGAWCGAPITCPPLSYSDFNLDGRVNAADLSALLAQWGATPCAGECGDGEIEVPLEVQDEAKSALDFALQYAGMVDLEIYQAWSESVPAELREMVDAMIWETTKGLVE